jgi:dUTP pyrophosphatase
MSSYNRAFLLDILLLTPAATTPTYATPGSAGLDLYSSHDSIVYGYGRTLISTGISVALPPNCYGRIAGRSGLALTKGLMVGAGVIDPDFRGEIQVLLFNLSKNDYSIKRGDKIAQLITEQCRLVEPVVRLSLPDTGSSRGIQGFGSSDRKSPKADGFTAAHMVNNNPPGFEDFPYLSVYMDDKIETFVGNTHNNHPSRAAGVINDVMRKTQPDSSCSSGENSDSDVSKPSPAPLLDFAAGNATPTRAAKLDAYVCIPLNTFVIIYECIL